MTGLLSDLMRERADVLEAPHLDVTGIVREGDKRVRRRRTAVVGGVAALGVAAALAVPVVLGGGDGPTAVDRDPELVAAFAAHSPSYAVGSEITIDGITFDVGHTVRAYVQTDAGAVFSDPDGMVWAADGATVEELGRINAEVPHLVADGTRAAWVTPGDIPAFTVFDQSTGETVRDPLQNVDGMSDVRDGKNSAVVYALDGETAYVKTQQGAAAWDTATGDLTFLDTEANGFSIIDAEQGQIVYTRDDQGIFVGSDLRNGTKVDLWTAYLLSPDGRYLLGEPESDDVRVYDIARGQSLPKDDLGYEYLGGYDWIDADHYAAIGFTETNGEGPIDVLSCTVSSGSCDKVAEDIGTLEGGFTIPMGTYLS
jgi:hypothetical protein